MFHPSTLHPSEESKLLEFKAQNNAILRVRKNAAACFYGCGCRSAVNVALKGNIYTAPVHSVLLSGFNLLNGVNYYRFLSNRLA